MERSGRSSTSSEARSCSARCVHVSAPALRGGRRPGLASPAVTRALVSMPNDRPAPGVGDGLVLATRLALGLGEIAGETLADVVRTSLPQGATGPRGGLSRTALATASRARRAASP